MAQFEHVIAMPDPHVGCVAGRVCSVRRTVSAALKRRSASTMLREDGVRGAIRVAKAPCPSTPDGRGFLLVWCLIGGHPFVPAEYVAERVEWAEETAHMLGWHLPPFVAMMQNPAVPTRDLLRIASAPAGWWQAEPIAVVLGRPGVTRQDAVRVLDRSYGHARWEDYEQFLAEHAQFVPIPAWMTGEDRERMESRRVLHLIAL